MYITYVLVLALWNMNESWKDAVLIQTKYDKHKENVYLAVTGMVTQKLKQQLRTPSRIV